MDDTEQHDSKKRKYSHEDARNDADRERKRLPFHAKSITKNDMEEYRIVFARYLKETKDLLIEEISSKEAYARFKSFVHKW